MAQISFTLGLPSYQVEQFKKDYRAVWSGAIGRVCRPAQWKIWTEEGEVMVDIAAEKNEIGYNVAREIMSYEYELDSDYEAIADAIEEIGTPSAIEVANHIREDLKNV